VRHYDQKSVGKLMNIFEIEGCCKLEPEHKVAAIVDSSKSGESSKTRGPSKTRGSNQMPQAL
jgi:hypothetical protein